MITAVDTNIILDVLIPGSPFGDSSKILLDDHLARGSLIICEVVYAELAACFPALDELQRFLADTGMELVYSSSNSLFMAGSRWAAYARKAPKSRFTCRKCGHTAELNCPQCTAVLTRRLHVLADFLIGAHALVHAECLLSRDHGIYKTHFKGLRVIGLL